MSGVVVLIVLLLLAYLLYTRRHRRRAVRHKGKRRKHGGWPDWMKKVEHKGIKVSLAVGAVLLVVTLVLYVNV